MAKKQTLTKKGLRPPRKHFTKTHAKVYWPYLPLLILLIGGLFLNVWQPLQSSKPATLAYATEMSRANLLSSTNQRRADNGKAGLTLNSKLNASAQAKADDMVARDYWSHNTPDGQEPWVFIDAQGYNYKKAGENLAYGFSTSNDTVTGWMNSPSHKENMLDGAYTEVGFGFANSPNFVGTGNETIVVAHYGSPVLGASTEPAPTPAPQPVSQPQTQNAETQNTPQAQPIEEISTPAEENEPEFTPVSPDRINQPVTTENPVPTEDESQRITLSQQLTNGNAPWIAVVISTAAFALALVWLFKHYVIVRRFVIEGEHFVAHHPILDVAVLTVVAVAVYLSQSAGVVL